MFKCIINVLILLMCFWLYRTIIQLSTLKSLRFQVSFVKTIFQRDTCWFGKLQIVHENEGRENYLFLAQFL